MSTWSCDAEFGGKQPGLPVDLGLRDVTDIVPGCTSRRDWIFCHDSDLLLLNVFNSVCSILGHHALWSLNISIVILFGNVVHFILFRNQIVY